MCDHFSYHSALQLHLAAAGGHTGVCRRLIEAKANHEVLNSDHKSALDLALQVLLCS